MSSINQQKSLSFFADFLFFAQNIPVKAAGAAICHDFPPVTPKKAPVNFCSFKKHPPNFPGRVFF
jgi:hypothetical protein